MPHMPDTPSKSNNFKKNTFELQAWSLNQLVCGIDEVGRGCLAGPLVTAAVILPVNKPHRTLKDSKVMTHEERLKAYEWIIKHCYYGVGIVHHRLIDERNIYQATLISMKKALMHALASSPTKPVAILVDAMPLKLADTSYAGIQVHHFPKGERKSSSIAAASIVAKVRRDALMTRLDAIIPGYSFGEHKGYATKKHQDALDAIHRSIIHRNSFCDSLLSNRAANASQTQKSLFITESEPQTEEYDEIPESLC